MKEVNISGNFEWDSYLIDTGANLAPKKCFKQHESPPDNFFEVGVILEAVDQRSAVHDFSPLSATEGNLRRTKKSLTTQANQMRRFRAAPFSLAYVVEIWGPRIRVRLVGTDDRNDNWFMIDSDQIRPYPSGEPLQPPFGYMNSHGAWNRTISKEVSTRRSALKEWFFKPPTSPVSNLFKINDKIEAVDKRNAQLICPASIGDISGQYILVSFDGWSGAFDYWTRFDSRDIFPVGWCKLANHPLQAPGPVIIKHVDRVNNKSQEENMEEGKKNDSGDDFNSEDSDFNLNQTLKTKNNHSKRHFTPSPDPVALVKSHKKQKKKKSSSGKPQRKSNPSPQIKGLPDSKENYDQTTDEQINDRVDMLPNSHSSPIHKPHESVIDKLHEPCPIRRDTVDSINTQLPSMNNPPSGTSSSPEPCPSLKVSTKTSSSIPSAHLPHVSDIQRTSPFTINPIDLRFIQDPANWSIDEVSNYLISKSNTLREAAHKFREHEIDGQAFLLLTIESLNWMEIKIGPALKISHLIYCLSHGYY